MPKEILVDCIGLEPPEPLERVLEAISGMAKDQFVRMLIDREPVPLYPILTRNGYGYETRANGDCSYEVRIWAKE
jgi:uncharacterized protein (DUF2249 family)